MINGALNFTKEDETLSFKIHRGDIALIISFVLMGIWYWYFGCPIKLLTGISCPGCGMTRALYCILTLDFCRAWSYHPLIYFMPAVVILYFFRGKFEKSTIKLLSFFILTLFLVVYLLRVYFDDPIVSINFKSGVLYNVIQYLF